MTIRYHPKEKKLSCSVHDLLLEPPIERFSSSSISISTRMQLGQKIHLEHQAKQENSLLSYRREVPVKYEAKLKKVPLPDKPGKTGSVTLYVQGRIDGVFHKEDIVIIEEIKSVLVTKEELKNLSEEKLKPFKEQVVIYALFLDAQGKISKENIQTELVLISALDGGEHRINVPWTLFSKKDLIHERAKEILQKLSLIEEFRQNKAKLAKELPFPFTVLRPSQGEMVEAIEKANQQNSHALLHAPTGVGKTAAALWTQTRAALDKGGISFVVTAKNTQRESFVKTASLWEENGYPVKVVAIRAKAKLCANDIVLCHPEFCPYAKNYEEKIATHGLPESLFEKQSVWSPDDLFLAGKEAEVCPFELALDAALLTDVFIGDYNYIFDPGVFLKRFFEAQPYTPSLTKFSRTDHRLIVDEAHNLVSRGREYYSPSLSKTQMVEALAATEEGSSGKKVRRLIQEILAYMQTLAKEAIQNRNQRFSEDIQVSFEHSQFTAWRQTAESLLEQSLLTRHAQLVKTLKDVQQRKKRKSPQGRKQDSLFRKTTPLKPADEPAVPEDPVFSFLRALIKFETVLLQSEDPAFVHLLGLAKGQQGDILKILCRDAGPLLAKRHQSFASVLAMSGTLSPTTYYQETLGFSDLPTQSIAIQSPFPRKNLSIFIEASVDTSYRQRERSAKKIANLVYDAAKQREGNYLVAFPSYAYLERLVRHWRQEINSALILQQEPHMDERARSAFLEEILHPPQGPRLICTVTGGIFSEGVDFANNLLKGAFIIGPSLPRYDTENELIKRYFNERSEENQEGSSIQKPSGGGFDYAYKIPGFTRVVQAAGRVIRSPEDIGFIVLVGRRFATPAYQTLFPSHWKMSLIDDMPIAFTENLPKDIANFWKHHGLLSSSAL